MFHEFTKQKLKDFSLQKDFDCSGTLCKKDSGAFNEMVKDLSCQN